MFKEALGSNVERRIVDFGENDQEEGESDCGQEENDTEDAQNENLDGNEFVMDSILAASL